MVPHQGALVGVEFASNNIISHNNTGPDVSILIQVVKCKFLLL